VQKGHNPVSRRHGKTGSKEYRAWLAMRERCSCPRYQSYDRYGGRGIMVCERWQASFEDFFLDVGPAPSPQHSLGRIDNDGNYEPKNVAWQTATEQARNRARPRRRRGGSTDSGQAHANPPFHVSTGPLEQTLLDVMSDCRTKWGWVREIARAGP
jgi:hypothetical protein